MKHLCYHGRLRQQPRRYYTCSGAGRDDVGDRGQFTIDAILKATQRGEGQGHTEDEKGPSFQERVAFWLKRLGLVTSFDVRRIAPGEARPGHRDPDGRGGSNLYEAVVEIVPEGPRATLSDVGFGISQVLPVLVLLYYVPKGSMLLLEQPELHLHPSAQSSLADAILAAAIDRELQVLVESHSEHFLRRLQRRVAEGTTLDTSVHPKEMKVHPEDVKVYFVSSANGSAHLQDLRLNRYGGVENWPEHFFGDEMGEIAAIHKARLRRQHGGAPT